MTLKTVLPVAFTGGNSDTLPFLPYQLGVTPPKYRWLAATQPVASSASTVTPSAGTVPLTGTAKVEGSPNGNVLVTNGTSDVLTPAGVNDVKTLMVVGRGWGAAGTLQGIINALANVSTTTDNLVRIAAVGFTTAYPAVQFNDSGDHIIIISLSGTTLTYQVDGFAGSGPSTQAAGNFEVGVAYVGGAVYGAVAIREVTAWTTALSAADMVTLRANAKANYPTITA